MTDIPTLPLHYRPSVKFTYRWGSILAMSGSWDLLSIAFLGSRCLGNLKAKPPPLPLHTLTLTPRGCPYPCSSLYLLQCPSDHALSDLLHPSRHPINETLPNITTMAPTLTFYSIGVCVIYEKYKWLQHDTLSPISSLKWTSLIWILSLIMSTSFWWICKERRELERGKEYME